MGAADETGVKWKCWRDPSVISIHYCFYLDTGHISLLLLTELWNIAAYANQCACKMSIVPRSFVHWDKGARQILHTVLLAYFIWGVPP